MTIFIGKGDDITLSPVEQIPNFVPFDATLNTGFGGDYANLMQTPGSTTFHKATYNVTASGSSSLIVGDVQNLTYHVENVAHNGPYPDSTPNDPYHPKNVGPWDGLTYKPFYNSIVDTIIKFADDTLNVTTSSGQTNLISGDVQNIIFEALGIHATTGAQTHFTYNEAVNSARWGQDSEAVIQDNTIYAGNDKITVSGAGSNTVVGDAELFSMHALVTADGDAGAGASTMFGLIGDADVGDNTPYQMGNDTINATATTASNTLIGDVKTVLIVAETANSVGLSGRGFIGFDSMIFGNDTINAGSGPNSIYGDVKDFDLQALSGNAANGLSSGATAGLFQSFTFGSDTLNGGSNVDSIYGDGGHFALLYQAGNVSNGRGFFGSDGAQLAENLAISNASVGGRSSTYIAGNDTIHGNGGNDTIVGDFGDYNITLIGGDVTGASGADVFSPQGAQAIARVINNLYTMGNDTLFGDAGKDTLIGDVQTLTLSATDGNAHNLAGVITVASFSGDTTPLQSPPGSVRVDTGSTLTFGSDVLNGGSGDDILIGDSIGIADGSLRTFLTYSPQQGGGLNLNQVLWGNDKLTGGTGDDQFASQLFHPADMGNDTAPIPTALIMQGNDTITDYGSGTDTLVFINGVSRANLDAHTTITHVNVDKTGPLDSVITFDGGGSLTVLNTDVHNDFGNVNVAFHIL